jgi:hypothetical protein
LADGEDEKLASLLEPYFLFRDELDERANAHGFLVADLDELAIRLTAVRNESRPMLYLPRLLRRNGALLRQYVRSRDPRIIADRIENLIAQNRRFFPDSAEKCVIREWEDRLSGAKVSYAFLPHAAYAIDVTVCAEDQTIAFFGQRASRTEGVPVCVAVTLIGGGDRSSFEPLHFGPDRRAHVRLRISADVSRVAICLTPRSQPCTGSVFDLLPRAYSCSKRQLARHWKLPFAVSAVSEYGRDLPNSGLVGFRNGAQTLSR